MSPALVVLAAGASRRFGSTKQLADVGGRPLVRVAVECACASRLRPVIVVVGSEAAAVTATLGGLSISTVVNGAHAQGQSTSVRAGLGAVPPSSPGAMFLPADQPGLTPAILDTLCEAFERRPDAIVVPSYGGRRGSPVTFPRELFPQLESLSGDTGGRALLGAFASRVVEVPFDSTRPLVDIDTPGDRDAWLARARGGTPEEA
jgi:molybdenum cofactor cytidylyltransferase